MLAHTASSLQQNLSVSPKQLRILNAPLQASLHRTTTRLTCAGLVLQQYVVAILATVHGCKTGRTWLCAHESQLE
jgi:hypothetical protein